MRLLVPAAAPEKQKRNTWMLCNIIPRVNAMLVDYKTRHCNGKFNQEKTIRLHSWRACKKPGCWNWADVQAADGSLQEYRLLTKK
jgi:hypothetical protein